MGGVHPSENKLSCAKPIEVLPLPDVVTIPLAQHIGAPAVAKVAKGDRVLTGQLIAEAGSFMSANIHSPISGTVTAVDMVVNGQGLRQMMITIKREGDDWAEGIDRSDALVKVCPFSAQEIIAKIKDAGIVGMGGATFPTHLGRRGDEGLQGRMYRLWQVCESMRLRCHHRGEQPRLHRPAEVQAVPQVCERMSYGSHPARRHGPAAQSPEGSGNTGNTRRSEGRGCAES